MNAATSFWKSFPKKSIAGFLLGVFFLFSAMGFVNDVEQMGGMTTLRLVTGVLASGVFATAYALSGVTLRKRAWKAFVPLILLQVSLAYLSSKWFPSAPGPKFLDAGEIARLRDRLGFDGVAITVAVALGYSCFVYASIREARRYARVHAEILVATEIHRVLVPPIDLTIENFEFYGRSLPSGEVGGDLIDVFRHGRGWVAYVADVSGHGVAPGVVMAMVKSAARMQLSSAEESSQLFERLNAVLYPIKKPEMFVTFAYLAWDGERLEYSLAGHPPILHFHAATGEISEVACSNLPVGMFAGQEFVKGSVTCASGDRFLLFTDGLIEITNSKNEEFGLAGVKSALSQSAREPASANLQGILDAGARHGVAADDRSVLLVCC